MKKIIYTFIAIFAIAGVVEAVNPFDIEYPIAELGNCASQQECKIYCDAPENTDSCIAFAESVGLIKKEDARHMREESERFERELEEFENSPGQCRTPRECDAYCRVEENLDECLDYGVKYGHTTQEEADNIRARVDRGGPGGCKSREECDAFCQNPENEDICFSFVVEEGKITAEEAEFMKERMKRHRSGDDYEGEEEIDEEKVEELLKGMNGPGGCSNMDECEAYCSDFNNNEECMQFAIEHQLAPPEALERMKRMSSVKSGPGGCMGRDECDTFCSNPENSQECFEFTKKHELMSPEELMMMEREMEIAEKLNRGMAGPGGCMGPQECDAFCRNPENIEECINFSGEHGLLEGDMIRDMMGKTQEARDKMMDIEHQREFFIGEPYRDDFDRSFYEDMPPKDFDGRMPSEGFVPPRDMRYIPSDDFGTKDPNFEGFVPEYDGEFRPPEEHYFNNRQGDNFFEDRGFVGVPDECQRVGALSPEACERHFRDMQNIGPGCGDCSSQCPAGVRTDCVNDRCVCGEFDKEEQFFAPDDQSTSHFGDLGEQPYLEGSSEFIPSPPQFIPSVEGSEFGDLQNPAYHDSITGEFIPSVEGGEFGNFPNPTDFEGDLYKIPSEFIPSLDALDSQSLPTFEEDGFTHFEQPPYFEDTSEFIPNVDFVPSHTNDEFYPAPPQ